MGVTSVTQWKVRQGHFAEFLENAGQAKAIHERLGAQVRVLQSLAGGEPQVMGYVMTFDDAVAYGEFTEKLTTDEEWVSFITETVDREDGSATLVGSSLLRDAL